MTSQYPFLHLENICFAIFIEKGKFKVITTTDKETSPFLVSWLKQIEQNICPPPLSLRILTVFGFYIKTKWKNTPPPKFS